MRRIFCLLLAVGCHDNTTSPAPDLSVVDTDMGPDAAGCNDGDACMLAGGAKRVCKAGGCGAGAAPADDGACNNAYGATEPYICKAGVCSAGCRVSPDCNGGICGIGLPNVCGACTTDAQCK